MVATAWRHAEIMECRRTIIYNPVQLAGRRFQAKFLVGQVPTCTNGVTTLELSWGGTRRNWNGCEDAAYWQQDKKTPWSFTVPWHWILCFDCV